MNGTDFTLLLCRKIWAGLLIAFLSKLTTRPTSKTDEFLFGRIPLLMISHPNIKAWQAVYSIAYSNVDFC